MSSGRITEDRKTISFEINNAGAAVGHFSLTHLDGGPDSEGIPGANVSPLKNPDRILMRMSAQSSNYPNSVQGSCSVIVTKDYCKILAHFFRDVSDLMDDWFDHPPMYRDGKKCRWVPGHYEEIKDEECPPEE